MTSRVIVSIRVPCSPVQAFDIFTQEIGVRWAEQRAFPLHTAQPWRAGVRAARPGGEAAAGLSNACPMARHSKIGPIRRWERGERLVVGWRMASFWS